MALSMSMTCSIEIVMPNTKRKALAPHLGRAVDASGYAVFSDGTQGTAHVEAHQALDEGRLEQGHCALRDCLSRHSGTGSEWIHLHFHMGIFELALGKWEAAYARFLSEILPAAETTENALTDAPALLWRIALSAHDPVALPWQPLRRRALTSMCRSADPFTQIHNLLALAGAGDVRAIEQSLNGGTIVSGTKAQNTVERMALALHAYARGALQEAAQRLGHLVPQLSEVGGSRAQLQLFGHLRHWCWQRANGAELAAAYSRAA